jgi:glycosyltransferase involved in cell wall biosynthesis
VLETTIVVSNYNYAQFLESSVSSCLHQTVPCTVIVVDDDSRDASWALIRKLVKRSKNLVGVRLNRNSGGNARGKNVGIALSNSKYIVCLDSDDMLLPDSVACRLQALGSARWIHGIAARVDTVSPYQSILNDLSGDRKKWRGHKTTWERYAEYTQTADDDLSWYRCIEASTVLAQRSVYEQFGLYDEVLRWKIDREMWYRLLGHGAEKKFLREYVSIYRHHPKQITRNRQVKQPAKVDRLFDKIVKERKVITKDNTLMLQSYDPKRFVQEIIGL